MSINETYVLNSENENAKVVCKENICLRHIEANLADYSQCRQTKTHKSEMSPIEVRKARRLNSLYANKGNSYAIA